MTRRLPPAVVLLLALTMLPAASSDAENPTDFDSLFPAPPTTSTAVRGAIRPAFVDASTRWAFRALDSVTVSSPIVRLGDVVRPLDPDMSGWQRLSRSPIGLVPLGGQVMTIDRQRLSQAIVSAEATARTIDWIGADRIQIRYRPDADDQSPTDDMRLRNLQPENPQDKILLTSAQQAVARPTRSVPGPTSVDAPMRTNHKSGLPLADPVLSKRLIYWIELAIGRHYPEVARWNDIKIDPRQHSIAQLQSANGVDHVDFHAAEQAIGEGTHQISVTGRTVDGPLHTEVDIVLQAHPIAMVPKESFRRGHLLQSHDLTTRPVPEDEWNDRYVTDAQELVGMEAKTTLRGNVPDHTRRRRDANPDSPQRSRRSACAWRRNQRHHHGQGSGRWLRIRSDPSRNDGTTETIDGARDRSGNRRNRHTPTESSMIDRSAPMMLRLLAVITGYPASCPAISRRLRTVLCYTRRRRSLQRLSRCFPTATPCRCGRPTTDGRRSKRIHRTGPGRHRRW